MILYSQVEVPWSDYEARVDNTRVARQEIPSIFPRDRSEQPFPELPPRPDSEGKIPVILPQKLKSN